MSRSIVLSNGELCVCLDERAAVRDIYYPHVGLEDHVRGQSLHRVGVWVDGIMSWLSDDTAWEISTSSEPESLASSIVAKNSHLQIELGFKDIVYHERSIFFRHVTVKNATDRAREIKLYFAHQFEIYKVQGGDTAYFDPVSHSMIHYKGRRVFLISGTLDGEPFHDYVAGKANFGNKEGSHRDADDGILTRNPIEHGPADSVIGLYGVYEAGQSRTCEYWLLAARSIAEAHELNQYIIKKKPEHLIEATREYWRAWLSTYERDFDSLTPEMVALFKRSLMLVRAHVDHAGGIIASFDSDILQHGADIYTDTYAYVWPRDAAYAAMALDSASDAHITKKLFQFCADVITKEGYFMHKYRPDKSLGSSWHPWIRDGLLQLPIQEDETALVIVALGHHYLRSGDREFIEAMYEPLVERAANFLVQYRDPVTKLPQASYDLWEEKRGTSTFTTAAVYGALVAAAELSKVLGKLTNEKRYRAAAAEVQAAIMSNLWEGKTGFFVKLINQKDEREEHETFIDRTIDMSSVYGIFSFGVTPPNDPKLSRAFDASVRALSSGISSGGIARYERDQYYRAEQQSAGNPWVITTLWYAEYLIAKSRTFAELESVKDIFSWVVKRALPSGVLAEQFHPQTGAHLSATPLAWSHAAYVSAILKYLKRREELALKTTH